MAEGPALADVVLHLGAHATDEGGLARWLALNRTALAQAGTAVVDPPRFARTISAALAAQGGPGTPEQEAALLDALAPGARRLVVSAPGLLGPVGQVIAPQGFYRRDVARRLHGLRVLFQRCNLTLLLAVRDPGQILPPLLDLTDAPDPETALGWIDDETLPWADLAGAMRRHVPGAEVVIWRHEALDRLWPQVLERLAGGDAPPLDGVLDAMPFSLSAEARQRARHYLARHPAVDVTQVQRILGAFARQFGSSAPDVVDGADQPDLPVWVQTRIAVMSAGYATEWDDIAHMPGVQALD